MAHNAPPPLDYFRLQTPLLKSGLSPMGANQFLNGQPMTNFADRQALLTLVGGLITNVGLPKCDGASKDAAALTTKVGTPVYRRR
jgi:hypothetical protein